VPARIVKKRPKRFRPKERPANGLFLPDYLTEVKMVAMRGLDDKEIAQVFGIAPSLFKRWKKLYPSFRDALDKGRLHCDAEVVAALFKKATGKYTVPHTEVIKYKDYYETLQMKKHYPPDTEAIKYWLNNRAREHWQQRSAVEQSGPGGKPIEITAGKGELIDAIVNLVNPKPDGDNSTIQQATAKSRKPKSGKSS
jgi:hypothetical protein